MDRGFVARNTPLSAPVSTRGAVVLCIRRDDERMCGPTGALCFTHTLSLACLRAAGHFTRTRALRGDELRTPTAGDKREKLANDTSLTFGPAVGVITL